MTPQFDPSHHGAHSPRDHAQNHGLPDPMTRFSGNLPIWYQLAQALRADITSSRLRPGQRIMPELALAEQHGISVMPVRQALRALEAEGLIVRRRGSGTYVSETLPLSVAGATSLEALYSREFATPASILERGNTAVPPMLAKHFPGMETLSFIRRLAFRGETPWSYGTLYVPARFAAQLTTDLLTRYPIYRLLAERCGAEIARSHFEVKAAPAGSEVAHYLAIEPVSPALALMCVTFDKQGKAVGAFDMHFPADPFFFSFETPH
ncbi:GntR family transcriptional regulator [Sphingomonas sp. MG17]|uniref:GntR family transcriptional regulator n=1 Tax=Sphingomonas tagetis TaxID=2949092 RepID=A0A9X2KM14_9SPHN|nr:GntR family transcriptional regulator [Sphingomonas tagetis]MCP3732114.1 GntR family transcriptional regulator [Sphingomonas tagetis]